MTSHGILKETCLGEAVIITTTSKTIAANAEEQVEMNQMLQGIFLDEDYEFIYLGDDMGNITHFVNKKHIISGGLLEAEIANEEYENAPDVDEMN